MSLQPICGISSFLPLDQSITPKGQKRKDLSNPEVEETSPKKQKLTQKDIQFEKQREQIKALKSKLSEEQEKAQTYLQEASLYKLKSQIAQELERSAKDEAFKTRLDLDKTKTNLEVAKFQIDTLQSVQRTCLKEISSLKKDLELSESYKSDAVDTREHLRESYVQSQKENEELKEKMFKIFQLYQKSLEGSKAQS